MSLEAMNKVWDASHAKNSQLLIMIALANRANEIGIANIEEGLDYLAKKARVTERQVIRMLRRAEETGELFIEHNIGRGHQNTYLITAGMPSAVIMEILIKRFNKTQLEAYKIANDLFERYIKGDIYVTFSQDEELKDDADVTFSEDNEIKGDIDVTFSQDDNAVKDDINVTFSQGEAIKSDANVTFMDDSLELKGDILSEKVTQMSPFVSSSSSLINLNNIKDKEEEEEDKQIIPDIDWGCDFLVPRTPREAENHPVIRLFTRVTGRIPGSKDYFLVIDTLRMLRKRFNSDQELVDYLVRFWEDWEGRISKSGHSYRRSSLVWLTEWAVNNDIPGSKRGDSPRKTNKSETIETQPVEIPKERELIIYLSHACFEDIPDPLLLAGIDMCHAEFIDDNVVRLTHRDESVHSTLLENIGFISDHTRDFLNNPTIRVEIICRPVTRDEKIFEQVLIQLGHEAPKRFLDSLDESTLEINDHLCTFYTPDQYSADLYNSRLVPTLKRMLTGMLNKQVDVEFRFLEGIPALEVLQ